MSVDAGSPPRKPRWMAAAKPLFRLLVLALVSIGIWRSVDRAWADLQTRGFELSDVLPGWLMLAGLLYVTGLLPSCWFWRRVLRAMGQQPGWWQTARAYYVGHLGKYFPGKALVVVLRTALIRSPQVDTTVAATSVFVETLTLMSVGALVAASVLIVMFRQQPGLLLLALGLMIAAGLPTLPPVFQRLVRLLGVGRGNPQVEQALRGLSFRLLGSGWLAMGLGWCLLGLSLWATLRSIPTITTAAVSWQDLPLITAAAALAMVAGFLSLLPGGIGVREFVVMSLLAEPYGAGAAAVSAVLLRLVWLLAELVVSGILYPLGRRSLSSAATRRKEDTRPAH